MKKRARMPQEEYDEIVDTMKRLKTDGWDPNGFIAFYDELLTDYLHRGMLPLCEEERLRSLDERETGNDDGV